MSDDPSIIGFKPNPNFPKEKPTNPSRNNEISQKNITLKLKSGYNFISILKEYSDNKAIGIEIINEINEKGRFFL